MSGLICVGVALLGLLMGSPPGAVAADTFDFRIGSLPAGEPDTIPLQSRTYWSAVPAIEAADPTVVNQIPIASLLGTSTITLHDATVEIHEPTTSIAIRGSSDDFPGASAQAPADVLVLFDWLGGSEEEASVVVSGHLAATTLAGALGDAAGLSGVDVDRRTVTVATLAENIETSAPDYVGRPANLPPAAAAFFRAVYGPGDLPGPIVPVLEHPDERVFLSLGLGLGTFPDVATDAFGWGDDDRAVLEGSLGIGFGVPFEPSASTWRLSGLLPTSPAESALMPDWLDFVDAARWRGQIAYDAQASRVAFTAAVDATFELFNPQTVTLQAQIAFAPSNPADISVDVVGVLAGEWPAPFGVDWLDVDRLQVTGTFASTTGDDGKRKTTVGFGVFGHALVAGKDVTVNVTGQLAASRPSGTIEVRMNDTITAAEVLDLVEADEIDGIDLGPLALPDSLPPDHLDAQIDNVSIRVDFGPAEIGSPPVTRTVPTVSVAGSVQVTLPVGGGIPLGANLFLSVGGDRQVTVAARADSDLPLSSLLPGVDIPEVFDLTLASEDGAASFGLLFTTKAIDAQINNLPVAMRRFLRPLHGYTEDDASPFEVSIPAGFSVLGSLELPEELTDIVDRLGWQSRVTARGTLPLVPSAPPTANLELEVALQSADLLPEIIHQVDGSIVLTGTAQQGDTGPSISVEFVGDLHLRLPAGLPSEVAGPLNDAFIPVTDHHTLADGEQCSTGEPLPVDRTDTSDDPDVACYDILRLQGRFSITAKADGSVELGIDHRITTPHPPDPWYPFGVTWFGIDELRAKGSVVARADSLDFQLGFEGDIAFADDAADLLAAVQLSVKVMAEAPWVIVELDGIRVASGAGFDTGHLLDLQHLLVQAAGGPAPRLDLATMGLPDVNLRNVDVAFSPKGVPDLCMPQGLTVRADLYVNPSADAPRVVPTCTGQQTVVPEKEEDRCLNRRADGCLASGGLRVSTTGISGMLQIPGFEAGPIEVDDLDLEVVLSVADAHLVASGGARFVNPTGAPPDPIAGGRFRVRFDRSSFTAFGDVQALGLRALVDTTAEYDVWSAGVPNFRLHLLLATDQYHLGRPNLVSLLADQLDETLNPLIALAAAADEARALAGDADLDNLIRIVDHMEAAGIEVPSELEAFVDRAEDFVDVWDFAIDHVGGNTFNLIMNGIPSYGGWEICFGVGPFEECIDFPGFGGTDGLCDVLPGLDDCTLEGIVDTYVIPAYEESMGAVADLSGIEEITDLIDGLVGLIDDQPLLRLSCAELYTELGDGAAFGDLTMVGSVFGVDFGLSLGLDVTDPVASVDDLVTSIIEQIASPGSATCHGFEHDLFTATPDVGDTEAVLTTLVVPELVTEGEQFTLEGSFSQPVAADHQVRVAWGDGQVEEVTVAVGEADFALDHVYADDDPSFTSSDLARIVVSDLSSGAGTSDDLRELESHVTIRNVAPVISGITSAGPVEEGRPQSFTVTFDDPGLPDNHRMNVSWGDGRVQAVNVPAGQRAVALTHTYRDDNPTGTPVDPYRLRIVLADDDQGTHSRTFDQPVQNVAPADLDVEIVTEELIEGQAVELHVAWTDPGLQDGHSIIVDWGVGEGFRREVAVPIGDREAMIRHAWGDNGLFDVTIAVIDDDTGIVQTTIPVEVDNVDPDVGIDRSTTFDTPGGPTFLTRVDVPLEIGANVSDPGSDDETLTWTWGDGAPADAVTDLVNPPAADPLPSPSIQPRDVSASAVHTYLLNCLYFVDVAAEDDDAGTALERAPVVVVGDADWVGPRGWWYEEYAHIGDERPSDPFDEREKGCALAIAAHMSGVLGEITPLVGPSDAVTVLAPNAMSRAAQFDRELLAVWLNYATGSLGSDADGQILSQFADAVAEAEQVRLDATATDDELLRATLSLQSLAQQQ
ncbi:hypothetical protein [Intrasporangium sp.]|uniref:hypothetical protein n=1 Tax=Intrasporangium sp. TaxID=1925024 RepID=UPI00293B5C34|nr:hypothetical protein [Intrasporangium sp.]MDV3222750.1 PKD domain-containing protein [Intrasporangium sp.]